MLPYFQSGGLGVSPSQIQIEYDCFEVQLVTHDFQPAEMVRMVEGPCFCGYNGVEGNGPAPLIELALMAQTMI